MKNFSLSAFTKFIPFLPSLVKHTSGVLPSILMIKLDELFALDKKYQVEGFYKFLKPVYKKDEEGEVQVGENGLPIIGNPLYVHGQSWVEHISFTEDEFRTAFSKIGIAYPSVSKFRQAEKNGDVFQGKFYCSYIDRKSNLTYYLRNHALVDQVLESISHGESLSPENRNPHSQKRQIPFPKKGDLRSPLTPENPQEKSEENTEREGVIDNSSSPSHSRFSPHKDSQTGVWLGSVEDLEDHEKLVKTFGAEQVIEAAAKIQGRCYISKVIKVLPQIRGSKVTPGKFSGFAQKNYSEGINKDNSF
jgi:hypothetical protein